MAAGTIVKDFIKVEGINTKVSDKLPEAFRKTLDGSLKTATGWLNVRQGVDMGNFVKDGTYEVEIEISEKGNKTVISVPSLGQQNTSNSTTTSSGAGQAVQATYNIAKSSNTVFEKRDNSMEAGGIMHDAVALAVGIGVVGLTEEEAVKRVQNLAEALLEVKRNIQG